MQLPANYDAWRLSAPEDGADLIGTEDGETCNRFPEPDEDTPRGWRPRRCTGTMTIDFAGYVECSTCGALA